MSPGEPRDGEGPNVTQAPQGPGREPQNQLLKNYVGAKIVRATPMDECSFLSKTKGEETASRETRPGYLVNYPSGGSQNGIYQSWSPKEVFENAYREITEGEANFIK